MSLRLPFPLYLQILFWFLVNVAVVVGVITIFVQRQLDVDSLVSAESKERLEWLAEVVSNELRESTRADWPEIFARHEEAGNVSLGVFTPGERHMGGDVDKVPVEVSEALRKRFPGASEEEMRSFPRRPTQRPGAKGAKGGKGAKGLNDAIDDLIDEFGPARPPVAPGAQGGARPTLRAPDQVDTIFIEKVGDPERYWAGILVPLGNREHRHFPQGVLMIVADEDGGGVFFDPSPWIWYGVGLLGISALIWIPFVRSLAGRIKSLTRATEEISDGQFTVRPGTNHRDEVGRLSRAVDRMAERLDQHLLGQRRFLGDIAHELRSPIARMRMTLGILDQRLTELANRERVADVDEEAGELAKLVDEILAFSKASIRPEEIELENVPLVDIIEPVLARESEGGPVQMEINGSLLVHANKTMLQRAFANVLRNALKYSGENGEVIVEAETEDDHVVLRVGDDGPGVPEEELARLTEPFYRPELARTRESGGFGLGLSIAKTCVESCGGTLSCRNRETGGFIVSIRVPKGENSAESVKKHQ